MYINLMDLKLPELCMRVVVFRTEYCVESRRSERFAAELITQLKHDKT